MMVPTMKKFMQLVAAFAVLPWFSSISALAEGFADVEKAWQKGQPVMIVITPDEQTPQETYGDWSYYLNEFEADDQADFISIFPISPKNAEAIPDGYNGEYSVLAFQKEGPAYFYEGPIVEPQVYEYLRVTFAREEVPAHIEPFAPEPVKIRFERGSLVVEDCTRKQ